MPSIGVGSWENTISDRLGSSDAYYYQYQSHTSTLTPSKRINAREKNIRKEKWKKHENIKNKFLFYGNSSDSNTKRKYDSSTDIESSKMDGSEFEYPNVVPYNKILVPNSLYVKNTIKTKLKNKDSKVLSKLKKSKYGKYRKVHNRVKTEKKVKPRRAQKKKKKSKLRRNKKSQKNPVTTFFRGIYYQYFNQKDRQLGPFNLYPVTSILHHMNSTNLHIYMIFIQLSKCKNAKYIFLFSSH